MFKSQNNVPEVYVNESRDFQLFTRLFDSAYNSTKFSIDKILDTANTQHVSRNLLPLLAFKLGLFDTLELSERNERLLLTALPVIFRNKGSVAALDSIIQLYSRMYHVSGYVYGNVGSTIQLVFDGNILNESWLFQLLVYVLPTGYQLSQIAGVTKQSNTVINVETGGVNVHVVVDKSNTLSLTKTPNNDNSLKQTILTLKKQGD